MGLWILVFGHWGIIRNNCCKGNKDDNCFPKFPVSNIIGEDWLSHIICKTDFKNSRWISESTVIGPSVCPLSRKFRGEMTVGYKLNSQPHSAVQQTGPQNTVHLANWEWHAPHTQVWGTVVPSFPGQYGLALPTGWTPWRQHAFDYAGSRNGWKTAFQ